jgi:YegS/Rv2252/BmrU family lipid kinase
MVSVLPNFFETVIPPSRLIIFNPAAQSDKAARLIERLSVLTNGAEIRLSSMPGESEQIARSAVHEGYTTIIAAGGDGTINEVVNGLVGSIDKEFPKVTLGILPVGTMNVFAVELGIPLNSLEKAWAVIEQGAVRHLDLPRAGGRCFVQLAGAGLDAEVVRRTTRESKKALGPLSYLVSLAQVAGEKPPPITIECDYGVIRKGSFILFGNGRFYGGPFKMFRQGSQTDGLLDALVFKNQSPWDLFRYMQAILMGQHPDLDDVEYFQSSTLFLNAEEQVPYELDGEMVGYLPLSVTLDRGALTVLAPA